MIETLKSWKAGAMDLIWNKKEAKPTDGEPVVQPTELETTKKLAEALNEEVLRLRAASLLKDEIYLQKYIENDNFKSSVITTLGAIALAHGGEYLLSYDFTGAVANGDKKVNIHYGEDGMMVQLLDKEPEEKGV